MPEEATTTQPFIVPDLARPRASRRNRPIVLLAVVALLVGGGLASYLLVGRTDRTSQVASPTSPSSAAPSLANVGPATPTPSPSASPTASLAQSPTPSAARTPSRPQTSPTRAPVQAPAAGPSGNGKSGSRLACMDYVGEPPQNAGAAMRRYNQAINDRDSELVCAMNETSECDELWPDLSNSTWFDVEIVEISPVGGGKWAVRYTGRTKQPAGKGFRGQSCSVYDLVYYLEENSGDGPPYVITGREPGHDPFEC